MYDVHHHLDTPASTSTTPPDPLHDTNDSLVVMWMYSTISTKLVDMVIDDSTTAHEVWKKLRDLFHDNKASRIIQLDNEIRNMVIGNMSVTDYFQDIKSKADRLANLGSKVSDSSLVTYTINGLRAKFPEIVRIIRHREPLPSFDQVRSMILLEESDMAQITQALSSDNLNSSSPTVLVASTTNNPRPGTNSNSGGELCPNFQRGSCTYGSRCKFIHGANESRSRSTNSGTSVPGSSHGSTQVRTPKPTDRMQTSKAEAMNFTPAIPHSFFGMAGMQYVNPYFFGQPNMQPGYSVQPSTMGMPFVPQAQLSSNIPMTHAPAQQITQAQFQAPQAHLVAAPNVHQAQFVSPPVFGNQFQQPAAPISFDRACSNSSKRLTTGA
ncbi:hypothetical protein CTI12_AA594320 [Artemisia annua]|uniref:C3H1-type domain-containing protein n=1 Tax=Artemisia annua TaxID=35608 RepID=A0A2U1KJY8_ARTAN|nr:hypothetical protein CTI12_AA594320 [Artemisia annua]